MSVYRTFLSSANEHYFTNSHDYIPERGIPNPANGVSEASVTRAQQVFQPFSLGPRHCIGKHLAMKEVSLILANVLWLFEVNKVEGSGRVLDHLPWASGMVVMALLGVFTSLETGREVKLRLRGDVQP